MQLGIIRKVQVSNLQLLFSLLYLKYRVKWLQEYQHNKEQAGPHRVSQTHLSAQLNLLSEPTNKREVN